MIAILPLLLAGAAPSAADHAAIGAAVDRTFAPYQRETSAQAAWDYPVYSDETAALIAHWERVRPSDEVDALSDGDWLCQCQEWDWRSFAVAKGKVRVLAADSVEVPVRLAIGWNGSRSARLRLKREQGAWKIDDLFYARGMPRGLKQALRETIRADERLPMAARPD